MSKSANKGTTIKTGSTRKRPTWVFPNSVERRLLNGIFSSWSILPIDWSNCGFRPACYCLNESNCRKARSQVGWFWLRDRNHGKINTQGERRMILVLMPCPNDPSFPLQYFWKINTYRIHANRTHIYCLCCEAKSVNKGTSENRSTWVQDKFDKVSVFCLKTIGQQGYVSCRTYHKLRSLFHASL